METVTFLFTDIEGSTAMLQRLGDGVYGQVLAGHHALIRSALAAHDGREVDTQGDAFFAVFSSPRACVAAVLEILRAMQAHAWPAGEHVRVRMGIHSGEAERTAIGLVGLEVHRAARVAAVGHGGQVLVSEAAAVLVRDGLPPGAALRDLGVHRLKDLTRPEQIFQLDVAGFQAEFPPLRSLGNPAQHNLPVQLSTFIGRDRELAEVRALMESSRLVTVTGPGGVGKTRLTVEMARQVAGQFADGVWLTELTAVQEPEAVPAAVAGTLGIPQASGLTVEASLAAVLARQQVLLVLDNCEHIIDAAAELCETLLPAADDMRIVATSREPLQVAGEARYRLPTLSVPEPDGQGETGESEAVSLFAARARLVDPSFSLDRESGPVVARLVTRLDGMPLAIELAAARVEALGLGQLLERLDDRFELLAGGHRGAAARQRSLAATVDWSYQLLSQKEQQVFRQLSIFPGPFTLEAAKAVVGAGAEAAVLHLVDCSLISPPRTGPDGRARYLMLETLRAYGADRLAQAGEQQTAAVGLASYALGVGGQAMAGLLTSAGELAATQSLDAEDATLQQVLAWAVEHDPGLAVRLAVALTQWWVTRGRVTAGYSLLRAAVERAEQDDRAGDAWPAAQFCLGYLANMASDFEIAIGHYDAVLATPSRPVAASETSAARERLRSQTLADAMACRANSLLNIGRTAEAAEEARRALAAAREIDYPAGEARALLNLSMAAGYAGDDETALDWARQAAGIDPLTIPGRLARQCNHNVADVLIDYGELAAAEDSCVSALDLARQAGDVVSQSFCLDMLADLDQRAGRIAEAGAHLREALEISTRIGHRLRLIDCLNNCGHLCAATQRWADAITMWAAYSARLAELGVSDLPAVVERRREPLLAATSSLGPEAAQAAEKRGQEMTLATAAELAILLAGTDPGAAFPRPDLGQLTVEEQELVVLIAQGRTDAEIAGQLHLTLGTARSRVNAIRDKVGCPRRADLIPLALQAGLV